MRTSINIKYDLGDKSLLAGYYATNAHSSLIKNILKGEMGQTKIKAHIAFGPYGSGKSYISTLLTGMLTQKIAKKDIESIAAKYGIVDEDISSVLRDFQQTRPQKHLPVLLNGYEGDFAQAIIKALNNTLRKYNIDFVLPGTHSEIEKIIKRWKNEYVETYVLFTDKLEKYGYNEETFHKKINAKDEDVVNVFDRIHKELTGGAEFQSLSGQGVIEILESVSQYLSKRGLGLFIVYDEFGRLLQNLRDNAEINAFMQTLQDLAELSNNGVDNLSMLFIAHRPIGYYFSFASKDMRNEFAKVEKRFKVHEIKSDYTTFLKITEGYIKEKIQNNPPEDIDYIKKNIHKYNVFHKDLTDTEVDNVIVKNLYPLHPITTFLLPKISSVFGQNERTLFTFLTDSTRYGLYGFSKRTNFHDIYYPDYLVDYFLSGIDESYVEDVKEYTIFKKNIDNISTLIPEEYSNDAERVYKFLLIWDMSKRQTNIKLSTDFIAFALEIALERVNKVLELLADKKMARYNVVQEQWEIFEGSPINLDKVINLKMGESTLSEKEFVHHLEANFPNRNIFPHNYNAEVEMTRFATVQFTTDKLSDSFTLEPKTDYNIVIDLGGNYQNSNERVRVVSHKAPSKKIRKSIHRLKIVDSMLQDNYYLRNYPNIDSELEHEREKLIKSLEGFYQSVIQKAFGSLDSISRELDEKFKEIYPHTFRIVNDQINMFQLTKIQKKAIAQVLDAILRNASLDLDHIFSGTKPTDLVYYTTIEKLHEHSKNKRPFKKLSNDLNKHILENPSDKLSNLIDIAIKPPYGLRPQVAMLITFSMIIDKWKDMMLFYTGSFIPSIETEDLITELMSEDSSISYVFDRFDNENRGYLEQLEEVFPDIGEGTKEKSLSVRVCSGMYNWYLALPIITQQQEDVSISQKTFLQIVAKSRINPKNAVDDLMDNFDIEYVKEMKNSIESHLEMYKKKLLERVYTQIGIKNTKDWASSQEKIHHKNNRLVKSLLQEKDLFSVYADDVENIDITRWTKSSFKNLEKKILDDYRKLSGKSKFQVIKVNGEEKHIQDVDLSLKAETTLSNLNATIDATKRYYSEAELEQIVLKLVGKYIK